LPSSNQEIIQNALRLIAKARALKPHLAAEYLNPLAMLGADQQSKGSEQAVAAVRGLLEALRSGNNVAAEEWDNAVDALKKWQATLS
jgi:hypothetical protein